MKVFNKIKIRTKLIILIILMVIGVLVVGSIGYYHIGRSNKALSRIYEQNLVSIELLSDARTQLRANYANVLLLITDGTGQKEVLKDIDTRKSAIDEDLKKYEQTELDESENKQYILIKDNLVTWNTVLDQVTELAATGEAKEAVKLFLSSGKAAFENLQTTVRDLVDYNIEDADSVYQDNSVEARMAVQLLTIAIILTVVLCTLLGILIIRTITKPISEVVRLIKRTSNLELVYDSSFDSLLKHKDEIGVIAQSVEILRNAMRDTVSKIMSISNNLATNSESLTESTKESTKTINQVVSAINDIAQGNGSQATMVTKTSNTVSSATVSIEEVNRLTAESVDNAAKSAEVITAGQKAVDMTADKMQDNIMIAGKVSESIRELSQKMERVSNITDVINSIAAQTNLLALNAAIEAARAGEAGKGFAVVAEEIRQLAEGSASAVKEITEIIVEAVEKNAEAADNMGKTQEIVSEQAKAIDITKEAFEKIKASVEDIANRITNVSTKVNDIDNASREILNQTQDMAAVAEQSAASSEEISASSEEQLASTELIAAAANDLSVMAVDLKNEISRFKM